MLRTVDRAVVFSILLASVLADDIDGSSKTINSCAPPAPAPGQSRIWQPADHTWGCSPGTNCNPPKPTGCKVFEGPPDPSYVCPAQYCQPPPDIGILSDASTANGSYPVINGVFYLDPRWFGLTLDIFKDEGVKVAERHAAIRVARQDNPTPPFTPASGCFGSCNLAFATGQRQHGTPDLCVNTTQGTGFLQQEEACQSCVSNETSTNAAQEGIDQGLINQYLAGFVQECSPTNTTNTTTSTTPPADATGTSTITTITGVEPNPTTTGSLLPLPTTSTPATSATTTTTNTIPTIASDTTPTSTAVSPPLPSASSTSESSPGQPAPSSASSPGGASTTTAPITAPTSAPKPSTTAPAPSASSPVSSPASSPAPAQSPTTITTVPAVSSSTPGVSSVSANGAFPSASTAPLATSAPSQATATASSPSAGSPGSQSSAQGSGQASGPSAGSTATSASNGTTSSGSSSTTTGSSVATAAADSLNTGSIGFSGLFLALFMHALYA